jgi:CBS-domain-containing membrane protein
MEDPNMLPKTTKEQEKRKPGTSTKRISARTGADTKGTPVVEQLMSRPVHRMTVGHSLNDAARLMWEHDVGAIPVMDQEDRVHGIVTDRDIAMAAYLQGKCLRDIPVETVMAKDVTTVRGNEPAQRAAALMARHQFRRLPVLSEEGALVGILSLNDLAGASADPSADGVTEHDVTHTLRAICAPRAITGHLGHEEPIPA